MSDEEEVRELIGRMSAAQRQGFHVTPAMIAHILAALRFFLSGRAGCRPRLTTGWSIWPGARGDTPCRGDYRAAAHPLTERLIRSLDARSIPEMLPSRSIEEARHAA